MDDVLEQFKKLSDELNSSEKPSIEFSLRLEKPSNLVYDINSFVENKRYTNQELFEKKLSLFHGVESTLSYTMFGDIDYPDEFKSKRCTLDVNTWGGSHYIEYAERGYIGEGWYEKDRFNFRFHVSPQTAKDIIDRRLLMEKIVGDNYTCDNDDDNWVWERVRFWIVDYKIGHDQNLWFYINRVLYD